MGMEVELQIRIARNHFLAILVGVAGIQDAERIGQHETPDRQVAEGIDEAEDIFGRVLDAVRPIFQIDVHGDFPFGRQIDDGTYIGKMLFGSLTELLCHVPVRAFAE